MVPTKCKSPTKPWFLRGFRILGGRDKHVLIIIVPAIELIVLPVAGGKTVLNAYNWRISPCNLASNILQPLEQCPYCTLLLVDADLAKFSHKTW